MLNLTRRKREVLPELQQNWMLHGHLLRLRFLHQSNRWHNFQCLIFSLHRHTHMLKQKNIARVFPFKVIRIPESEKCLHVKSEILDFGIRNSAEESGILLTIGVRNPSSIDNGKDKLYCSVADPGGGGGGGWRGALLLLIIRPNWGPKGQKKFFWRPGPPAPLSKGLDDRPPTPLSQGLDPALLFPSYYKFVMPYDTKHVITW